MSQRLLFEVNTDYAHVVFNRMDLSNAGHCENARKRLKLAGIEFLGQRHHADRGLADLRDWEDEDEM